MHNSTRKRQKGRAGLHWCWKAWCRVYIYQLVIWSLSLNLSERPQHSDSAQLTQHSTAAVRRQRSKLLCRPAELGAVKVNKQTNKQTRAGSGLLTVVFNLLCCRERERKKLTPLFVIFTATLSEEAGWARRPLLVPRLRIRVKRRSLPWVPSLATGSVS